MSPTSVTVLVLGCGYAGLSTAIALQGVTEDYVVVEANDDVGGTWLLNKYPGCACDVPAHAYSFSFEQNPFWSEAYAPRDEIYKYIRHVWTKYNVDKRTRLGHSVQTATWDETLGVWIVNVEVLKTGSIIEYHARFLVLGCGALHEKQLPSVPGIQSFRGKTMHSADWDDSYSFDGKRVAVVGTGASSTQIVPELHKRGVASLTVVQRTPNWVVGRQTKYLLPDNLAYSDAWKWRFANIPLLQRLYRAAIYMYFEATFVVGGLFVPYKVSLFGPNSPFLKKGIAKNMREMCRPSPDAPVNNDVAQMVLPDYAPGCKRVLKSDTYLQTLCQENVRLVTGGLRRVHPNGIESGDGDVVDNLDAIVYATGFQAGSIGPLTVTGKDGRSVTGMDLVDNAMEGLHGMSFVGFPNSFFLYSVNTNLGHYSIVFMLECQAQYIASLIRQSMALDCGILEVKPSAVEEYYKWVWGSLGETVWATGCQSWYKNKQGKVPLMWPDTCSSYWWQTRNPKLRAWFDVRRPLVHASKL